MPDGTNYVPDRSPLPAPPGAPPAGPAKQGILWPNDRQRTAVIGKTGSGKTQGAAWLLANRSYDRRPWIIFDFKRDELLNDIPGARHIGLDDKLPKHPGIYLVHPHPSEQEDVDAMLSGIWDREGIGVFVDEGYMIPDRSDAFQALLTQGRSKRIPMIVLTQRPAWITRFAFSEADYIQLYQLTDTRDIKVVKQFMPMPIERRLPGPYYSWWYDATRDYKAILQPVPDRNTILDTFHAKLVPRRRTI